MRVLSYLRNSFSPKALAACAGLLLAGVGCQFKGADSEIVSIEERSGANPWNHLRFQNDPENFQFAIVTDLTGRLRPNVFPDAVRKLNLLQPEFVMTIGDLIEGHTNDEARLSREWDEFFKAVEPLEMPMFYVPGNHDYYYRSSQNAAGKVEEYSMGGVYDRRVGRSYFHFVYRDVLFLVLNNSMPEGEALEAQKKYITETLKQHENVRWTFTFFHYDQFMGSGLWRFVHAALGKRPFTALAGNSHTYLKYRDENGREMIRLATTGGMSRNRGPAYGEFDHITLVTMTPKGPRLTNVMLDGLYDTNIRTVKSEAMTNLLLEGTPEGTFAGRGPPVNAENILVRGETFNGGTTKVALTNRADIPLQIKGSFERNSQVLPDPAFFDVEVAANSTRTVELKLQVSRPTRVREIDALVLNWSGRYELAGDDPDVNVTGKHRILIDSAGQAPRRDWPVIVEKFDTKLDPAWLPLGPGGSFGSQGYVLRDDAPLLAGEEPDSEGRATDGPLFEVAVHTPVKDRLYRYTDGRGIYMETPLFYLPIDGLYRDLPAGSFEAHLDVSGIKWAGDQPQLHWEFWDSPDQVYNYGPSYLSGVILKVVRDAGAYALLLQKFKKTGYGVVENNYVYTDLARVPLKAAPSALKLRADWRESSRTWRFFYGTDGAEAATAMGGEFVEDIRPSAEGKRNVVYVPKAKQGGFSVVLDEYRVLH